MYIYMYLLEEETYGCRYKGIYMQELYAAHEYGERSERETERRREIARVREVEREIEREIERERERERESRE